MARGDVNFVGLRDAATLGPPWVMPRAQMRFVLDITTMKTVAPCLTWCALTEQCFILNRCGGVRTVEDVPLLAGADKVSFNSALWPIMWRRRGSFGSQCIVCAIDAKPSPANGN